MRHLKLIQDLGFNYIYLQQNEAITRINLLYHSYRDVARTPIEDYELATLITISSQHSWNKSSSQLWICGASEGEKEEDTKEAKDPYILEPLPNNKFILDAWMDTLATVDVCLNEVTLTVFCNKEGYDMVPFRMVSIIHEPLESIKIEEENTNTTSEKTMVMYVK